MDSFLLNILCCPETGQSLRLAEKIELENLNAWIHMHSVFNRAGKAIHSSLNAALIREDGQIVYPICEDIPLLLVEEGIVTAPHLPFQPLSPHAS